jgi:hypothetical protein
MFEPRLDKIRNEWAKDDLNLPPLLRGRIEPVEQAVSHGLGMLTRPTQLVVIAVVASAGRCAEDASDEEDKETCCGRDAG